jgi:hypothetical protein
VNKRFHAIAQLVAHRRQTIYYEHGTIERTHRQIQSWLDNPVLLRNIRQLTLTGKLRSIDVIPDDGDPDEADPDDADVYDADVYDGDLDDDDLDDGIDLTPVWAQLVELVTKAARLSRVNVELDIVGFPLVLLQALETYHPQVKLCIWNYHRHSELDHTDAVEQALTASPILHAIKANIWLDRSLTPIDLRTAAFKRIVANAPNLEIASIITGLSRYGSAPQEPDHEEREKRAAAKFLSSSRGASTSVRKLVLDGFSLNKETLLEWDKYVSLGQLEDLKFSRGVPEPTYFEAVPALLTNLKHLSLNLSSASRHPKIAPLAEAYLATTCAPLETLSLWSWKGVVSVDAMLKHGATLKRLELHEREATALGKRRGLLSIEEVRRIRRYCPQLEDFTLDMDREDADWLTDIDYHKDMLREIGRIGKKLQKVQIYLDLGVARKAEHYWDPEGNFAQEEAGDNGDTQAEGEDVDKNDAADVPMDYVYQGPFYPPSRGEKQSHALETYRIIFENSHNGARELEIKWGEWERKAGNRYAWFNWEQENKRRVVVQRDERDDMAGCLRVEVFGGDDDY